MQLIDSDSGITLPQVSMSIALRALLATRRSLKLCQSVGLLLATYVVNLRLKLCRMWLQVCLQTVVVGGYKGGFECVVAPKCGVKCGAQGVKKAALMCRFWFQAEFAL